MKKYFLSLSINLIKKYNPKYSEKDLSKINYGLEAVYLTITKFVIILIACIILEIVKEFIIFTLLYNFARLFAFGIHASKSYICLILSLIIFIILPYIAKTLPNNFYITFGIGLLSIIMMILYAPADTYKRPLINFKKRRQFKILSIGISTIYLIMALLIKNDMIANSLIFSLALEAIVILPITYKLFNTPYRNYLNYKAKGTA